MEPFVDGAAKAKKMEPKLPDWLIEGIEKCNLSPLSPVLERMYSMEHRVYSHVPSITNHKAVRRQITKHGWSNHHFTLRWLWFSIVFFEKPPHRTKLDGRWYCVLVVLVHLRFLQFNGLPGCKLGGCLGLQATLENDLPWSPSMVFSVERTSPNHNARHCNGEGSQIVATSIFCTQGQYQNYNLQNATNTNRGKIDGVSNQGH